MNGWVKGQISPIRTQIYHNQSFNNSHVHALSGTDTICIVLLCSYKDEHDDNKLANMPTLPPITH